METVPVGEDGLTLPKAERERLAEIEHHVLKLDREGLGSLARHLVAGRGEAIEAAFSPAFAGVVLDPVNYRKVAKGLFRTRLSRSGDPGVTAREADASSFVNYLTELRGRFGEDVSARFRIRTVTPVTAGEFAGRWSGRCVLQLRGVGVDGGPREASLELEIDLASMPGVEEIKTAKGWISGLRVLEAAESASLAPLMVDVAAERGFDVAALYDSWTAEDGKRMQGAVGGIYAANLDDDPQNEILVIDINGLQLYDGLADGTFAEVGKEWLLPRELLPYGAIALGDFDDDGHIDLIAGDKTFKNLGNRRFSDISYKCALPIAAASGCVIADFDNDGRLDLYATYSNTHKIELHETSWFDGPGGPGNQLWLNRGSWRFDERATELNATAGTRSVFTAGCLDANRDGRTDIYVISEFGPGALLLNGPNGAFTETLLENGDGDFGSMGLAVGDIDNDGRTDLYTANMFSKAGRRILENLAEDAYPPEVMTRMKRFVTGTELYRNAADQDGAPRFERLAERLSLQDVGWAYGAVFTDLDGDGWLDLHATAGFMSVDPHEPDG